VFEALIDALPSGGFNEIQQIAAARRGEKNHARRMTKRHLETQDIHVEILGFFKIAHFESDVAQADSCHDGGPP